MHIEPNEKLNEYCKQKQLLHHQRERKEITEEEYVKKFTDVDNEWRKEVYNVIDKFKGSLKEEEEENKQKLFLQRQQEVQRKELQRKKNMVETQTTEKVQKTKTPRTNSQAALIEKALMMKSIKSYEAVADKVFEWDNTKDKKKVIGQAKIIVNIVKTQSKPRWKGYSWNESEFLLVKNN